VVRTLIVPAVVVLLGRWNWWPSGLHLRHLALERRARKVPAERIEVQLAGKAPGA
jgi:uncharacterized membrane protein YdfJ with MMPL/SSD domain